MVGFIKKSKFYFFNKAPSSNNPFSFISISIFASFSFRRDNFCNKSLRLKLFSLIISFRTSIPIYFLTKNSCSLLSSFVKNRKPALQFK